METYSRPNPQLWTGRSSTSNLYLHEKVAFEAIDKPKTSKFPAFAILGYCCDEGVRRNHGRPGAVAGPDAIRSCLAKLPNHLRENSALSDFGNVHCIGTEMEAAQGLLADYLSQLLQNKRLPLLLGGGHDMAYGHFLGIKKYLSGQNKTLGILNFDAHFDLRDLSTGSNSGTPFYQIAQDCRQENTLLRYLCLGIRKDANSTALFQTASETGTQFIENTHFNIAHIASVAKAVQHFLQSVDFVYVTIDLDGFSSAFAPGVSAASPMGFSPDIVLEVLNIVIHSKKLISLDIAEMNPQFDRDLQTAKLAASLLHYVMHGWENYQL